MPEGFVICPVGHRQWSEPFSPCAWCEAVEAGTVSLPVYLDAHDVTVRVPHPLTADEALDLSWFGRVPDNVKGLQA